MIRSLIKWIRARTGRLLLVAALVWVAARLPDWMPCEADQPNLAAGGASKPQQAADPARPDVLLRKFDLTAYRGDRGAFARDPIPKTYKAVRGMTFALLGDDTERFRDVVAAVVGELSRLTGLTMSLRPVGEFQPEDFLVAVIPPELIDAMLGRDDIVVRFGDLRPYDGSCFALPYAQGYALVKGVAVVPNALPDSWIRHCLIVEITQAFGLFADSDLIEPSIFSDHGPPRTELSLNDKIVVRTLYDPRITAGMPREPALAVAREVIRELVAAVRRDGVAALYQQSAASPRF